MNRLILMLPLAMMLSGCGILKGLRNDEPEVRFVSRIYIPEPLPVTSPTGPVLRDVTFDVPRDSRGKPVPGTQIFLGLTQEEYNDYVWNQTAIKLFTRQELDTISAMNKTQAAGVEIAEELKKANPDLEIHRYGPKQ